MWNRQGAPRWACPIRFEVSKDCGKKKKIPISLMGANAHSSYFQTDSGQGKILVKSWVISSKISSSPLGKTPISSRESGRGESALGDFLHIISRFLLISLIFLVKVSLARHPLVCRQHRTRLQGDHPNGMLPFTQHVHDQPLHLSVPLHRVKAFLLFLMCQSDGQH